MENLKKAAAINGISVHKEVGKVSIQGYEGSFHQEAARQFFGKSIEVIPCASFGEVVKIALDKKKSDGAVMAIENSIAGSILANYNLLRKSELRITGEIYLEIRQNFLTNPGVALKDVREVHSHPMAIQQCLKFLDKYNWKLVETEDTALSARNIHQHKSKHIAAIASRLAAELYQLNILVPDIQTIKNNFTRFWILRHKDEAVYADDADKASIAFTTDNSRGSLARVLTKIAEAGIDLSKLQSFPVPETTWRYMFGVDMEFENIFQFYEVIEMIKPLTCDVKVHGIYKKGSTVSI